VASFLSGILRDASADRREILPNDVNWVELYKLGPKIEVPPKNLGGKPKFKIWLKIQHMRAYNFEVRGVAARNFST